MNTTEETAEEKEIWRIRSEGYAALCRRELTCQILHDVRVGLKYRLEDIYAFADRENPNKEEIMEIVREIQTHFLRVEAKYLPKQPVSAPSPSLKYPSA